MSVIRELFVFPLLTLWTGALPVSNNRTSLCSDSYGHRFQASDVCIQIESKEPFTGSQCFVETAVNRKIHPRADYAMNRNRKGQIAIFLLLWLDLTCGTTRSYLNIASRYATLEQLLSRPTESQGCCFCYPRRHRMYQYWATPCLRSV
jgi:hypothetical protein